MNQNTKKKEWVVSKDDVGRATLQWTVDPERTAEVEADDDPLAQTYNFLRCLERPELHLEGDYEDEEEYDPYNSGVYSAGAIQSKR